MKFQTHSRMYVFIRPGLRRTEDIYSSYQTGAKKLHYRSPVKRASPGKRAIFGVAHTTWPARTRKPMSNTLCFTSFGFSTVYLLKQYRKTRKQDSPRRSIAIGQRKCPIPMFLVRAYKSRGSTEEVKCNRVGTAAAPRSKGPREAQAPGSSHFELASHYE